MPSTQFEPLPHLDPAGARTAASDGRSLRFALLGPLDVTVDGHPVDLGPAKQRLLFAALLIRPNEALSIRELTAVLWQSEPPVSATANLRTYIRGIRRSLGAGNTAVARVVATPGGYQLRVLQGEYDVDRFQTAAERGHVAFAAGDPARAVVEYSKATALWRGAPLSDLPLSPPLAAQARRLQEVRLLVEEERGAALLAIGAEAETVARMRGVLAHHPLRQRAWEQLMLGLYRVGDIAGALDAYRHACLVLAEQTGLDPAPRLTRLYDDILHHRASLTGPLAAAR